MKRTLPWLLLPLCMMAAVCLAGGVAHCAEVGFLWSRVTNASGYRLYHGPTSRAYTNAVVIGASEIGCTVTVTGKQFFAITAFSDSAESDFSRELMWMPPVMLQLVGERSVDGVLWSPAWTNEVQAIAALEFWRLQIGHK